MLRRRFGTHRDGKRRVVQRNKSLSLRVFWEGARLWAQLKSEDAQMNSDIMQGNWIELKGKVQKQWGKLTDDDLDKIEGKRKELVGRVQKRYGYAMDQAEKEVNSFFDDLE